MLEVLVWGSNVGWALNGGKGLGTFTASSKMYLFTRHILIYMSVCVNIYI